MSPATSPTRIHWNDFTHPVVAGLISVIVNYGGTFILVFQAAKVAGLSPELTASWVWSISIGVGVTGLFLSWMFREPIITAWSTPAAAFLVTALATTPYAEAVGAYFISAFAFVILGLSGWFERVIRLIPFGVAAGLLAGIKACWVVRRGLGCRGIVWLRQGLRLWRGCGLLCPAIEHATSARRLYKGWRLRNWRASLVHAVVVVMPCSESVSSHAVAVLLVRIRNVFVLVKITCHGVSLLEFDQFP